MNRLARAIGKLALPLLSAVLIGCSAMPPADDVQPVGVDAVRSGAVDSAVVRWGGTIAAVSNREDVTVLEVVSRPLRSSGRPERGDVTDGRFLARVDEFLDPEIVRRGRDITVTGRVTGTEAGRVGESDYVYAVVEVDDYRYWKPEVRVAVPPGYVGPYGYRSAYRYWPYDPWFDYPYHHHRDYRPARPAVGASTDF